MEYLKRLLFIIRTIAFAAFVVFSLHYFSEAFPYGFELTKDEPNIFYSDGSLKYLPNAIAFMVPFICLVVVEFLFLGIMFLLGKSYRSVDVKGVYKFQLSYFVLTSLLAFPLMSATDSGRTRLKAKIEDSKSFFGVVQYGEGYSKKEKFCTIRKKDGKKYWISGTDKGWIFAYDKRAKMEKCSWRQKSQ